MTRFAGRQLPVQYSGIIDEHLHTRSAVSWFDVSHMGIVQLDADPDQLETLLAGDLRNMQTGRAVYCCLTNRGGGIIDDLLLYRIGNRQWICIVNTINIKQITDIFKVLPDCKLIEDRTIMALQGPLASDVAKRDFIQHRFPKCHLLPRMHSICSGEKSAYMVSRTGYTGEDGFEFLLPSTSGIEFAQWILDQPEVKPAGLGARNTLRLEAGYCLHGVDIDAETTPVEAGLEWTIAAVRRAGGSRCGGFPGADIILGQIQCGPPRRRIGLQTSARKPVRSGILFNADHRPIGKITSGSFSPTLGKAIAMGMVETDYAKIGTVLCTEQRGDTVKLRCTPLQALTNDPP